MSGAPHLPDLHITFEDQTHVLSIRFDAHKLIIDALDIMGDHRLKSAKIRGVSMITAAQLRAARALLGIDQRRLAEQSGVSLPTIQRMEASEGNVRGVVDTLTKVVEALDRLGVELIGEGAASREGGRGVRLKALQAGNPNT